MPLHGTPSYFQDEYKKEGIDVAEIEFVDNRTVLDLFLAKPIGLLALIDEESNFPKATDISLVRKYHCDDFSCTVSRFHGHEVLKRA
jgi:myosin-3